MPPLSPLRFARMVTFAMSAIACLAWPAAAEPRGSGLQTWFTDAQAETGRTTFIASCAACHGASMLAIFRGYSTVEKYFNFISGSMPKHLPGSLPDEDYLAVVAYMLRLNGFKPGDNALTTERARMRQIIPAEGR